MQKEKKLLVSVLASKATNTVKPNFVWKCLNIWQKINKYAPTSTYKTFQLNCTWI